MEQGTPDWLEWRNGGVGSSDVAAIMGVSEHDTAHSLWMVKTKRKKPKESNWAMQRGKEGEDKIRALYELQTGLDVPPACVEHAEYSYLRVSLDGRNEMESLLVEMKYIGKEKHELAKQQKVPEYYYPQVQYQLAVTGMKRAHYVSYDGQTIEIVPVLPNQEYIANMLPKVKEFWECVLNDTPPALCERDYMELTDVDAVAVFEEWKRHKLMMMQFEEVMKDTATAAQAKALHKEHKKLLDEAKEKIQPLMKHPKILCAGVLATKRKTGALDIRFKEME